MPVRRRRSQSPPTGQAGRPAGTSLPKTDSDLRRKLEGLGEDFKYNLKLLEERDEELSRNDLEMYKLKVRFAERGAEINDLKEQITALEFEKKDEQGDGDKDVDYLEFDKDGASIDGASTNDGAEAKDFSEGAGREGSVSKERYLSLLEKYESMHADYVTAKFEASELRKRSETVDVTHILDRRYGDYGGSGAKRKDIETQLTFLKHELECERHLKHEALRSLEAEKKKNKDLKKTLLKDYESKCFSLMRHLKSVEDSFVEQQKENDRLREEHARKQVLEARVMHLADAAIRWDPYSVTSEDKGETGEGLKSPELTTVNLERHVREEGQSAIEGKRRGRRSSLGEDESPTEDALLSVESALADYRTRIRALEVELKQERKMAVRYHHRLNASVPLINLAYTYCSVVDKAASGDLKARYAHIPELRPVAKALFRYLKKSDEDLVPYNRLGLNTEPVLTEYRRLRNSGALGLAVFSLDED